MLVTPTLGVTDDIRGVGGRATAACANAGTKKTYSHSNAFKPTFRHSNCVLMFPPLRTFCAPVRYQLMLDGRANAETTQWRDVSRLSLGTPRECAAKRLHNFDGLVAPQHQVLDRLHFDQSMGCMVGQAQD